ncbi:hypothetical protein J1N35_019460 [Gossypium stocksii]|uniref:Gag-pol polyprotein n=1 Tax=Gossypium stocksii TaxID=47602 RepID=A0A9D3VSK0_9ROSI|nr:hypothetical protein J1N35_019460 [Gossypium stocksii]
MALSPHWMLYDMSKFALKEDYLNSKLVKKVLRSFSKRFAINVTFIQKEEDINSMRIDELIGSLQTFEMALNKVNEAKPMENGNNDLFSGRDFQLLIQHFPNWNLADWFLLVERVLL